MTSSYEVVKFFIQKKNINISVSYRNIIDYRKFRKMYLIKSRCDSAVIKMNSNWRVSLIMDVN